MAGNSDDNRSVSSRRDIFRLVGAASAMTLGVVGGARAQMAEESPRPAAPRREALETLTAAEARILEAFCARLVPTDAMGPGATEARAARYIDHALSGALATSRESYRSGLKALDTHARASKGAAFAELPPEVQDAILTDVEKGAVPGFTPDSATFFALVRGHTIQGMFSDPIYGGNADFLGWTLIGFPGIRLAVSKQEEAMAAKLTPVHKSAYEFGMFHPLSDAAARAPAPVDRDHMPNLMGDMQHGN